MAHKPHPAGLCYDTDTGKENHPPKEKRGIMTMKAYFDNVPKEVPEDLAKVFLDRHDTAVITIDKQDGHLSEDPDCPCP